ncbi:class I adenylate-forming enzyme family protein [Shimia biformata]|uniref:class I adenylate-forming enzyme family protein n=1 Tax=Shimia biformata TaxID=1294299 RepID=UPI00195018CD|nr:class I adenylate-forming enzyme family protein [Shimia biformata]
MLSVFDQGPWPDCPSPFNMAAHVLAHADDMPDKTALSVVSGSGCADWSYGAMKRAVLGTGAGLLARGLAPGDIVLMRLGNDVEFPIAYLGAIAVGLVPVPTSSQLTDPEVARIIDELSPKAILRDPAIACPVDMPPQIITTADLHAMRDLPPAPFHMGDPDRMAYVIYTSGTSGSPRAVAHAHRAIWARGMMHEGWYGLTGDDRLMHAGAFNWTYTLGTGLMDPWTVGATALIPAAGVGFDQLPKLIAREKVTIFAAVPGVYRKMLSDHPDLHLPDLRHGLTAGEKLSDTIRDAWAEATGGQLYEAYGMSECSTFISSNPSDPARPGTLGRPQQGRRIAIIGEDGPVPLGEEGQIAVSTRDPGLMRGYLNAPDEFAARCQGDWFLTGDLGVMGADFCIDYTGRADDMMNAGGFRVSPLEVEAKLANFPGLTAIGVTDVEIKQDVRVIAAFYTSQTPLDEEALARYAGQTLAAYKQPRLWQRLDALPVSANGKLLRRALQKTFEAQR